MSAKNFFLLLAVVTLIAIISLAGIHQWQAVQGHELLGWAGLAAFLLITVLMFYSGRKAARSDNKNDFTSVVMGFTAGKMFIVLMAIVIYQRTVLPDTNFFILPFFGMYLIYTIFETYVMTKLGRTDSSNTN